MYTQHTIININKKNHSKLSQTCSYEISSFSYMKVYCVFSLASPRRGYANEYTQHTIISIKQENHPKLSQPAVMGFFSKVLKNEFKTAMVIGK